MHAAAETQPNAGSFRQLLSPAVAVAEHRGAPTGTLLVQEASAAADAAPRRRLEFACGRTCARGALAQLGHAPAPIPAGGMREPLWPAGIVGSITHCADFCAAAVALQQTVRAIGIDVERNTVLEDDIFQQVSTAHDVEHLHGLSRHTGGETPWRTLLFSAKESLYKAWFPWTRCWLDFSQASILFDPPRMRFELEVSHPAAAIHDFPRHVVGRYAWTNTHVLTAIEL